MANTFGPPANVRVFQCEWYGADAGTNANVTKTTNAIQQALDEANDNGGGTVTLTEPGTYVTGRLAIWSKTRFVLGNGVSLFRYANTNSALLKNKYAGYINKENRFTRTSNVATVLDVGHTFSVGDPVYVRNLTDTTFNGLKTVASVATDTWTYSNPGGNYSSGSSTKYGFVIPVRRTVTLASFTNNLIYAGQAATGYVNVADALTDVRVGFHVFVASVGIVEVIRTDAVSWSYLGSMPTDSPVALSYDHDISIEGGIFQGNRVNQASVNGGFETSVTSFGCVNNLMINGTRMAGTNLRAMNGYAMQGFKAVDVAVDDCLVGFQFEGGGRRLHLIRPNGKSSEEGSGNSVLTGTQVMDDFIAFTGVLKNSVGYPNAASPYDLTNFDDLKIKDGYTANSLTGLKITADASITYDNIEVDGLTGGSLDPVPYGSSYGVRIMDDTASLIGTYVKKIECKNLDWTAKGGSGSTCVNFNTTGTVEDWSLVNCGYQNLHSGSLSPILINGTGTIKRMLVDGVKWTDNATSNNGKQFISQTSSSTIENLTVKNFDITFQSSSTVAYAIYYGVSTSIVLNLTLKDGKARGNAASIGALYRMIGRIDDIDIDNVTSNETTNTLQFIGIHTRTGGGYTSNIRLRNCRLKTLAGFGNSGTALGTAIFNILMGGNVYTSSGSSNFLQSDSGTFNVFAGPDNIWTDTTHSAYVGAGSQVLRINAPSMPFDISTAAAKITAVDGDLLYNTVVTGTITAAGVVIWNSTASKWTRLSVFTGATTN